MAEHPAANDMDRNLDFFDFGMQLDEGEGGRAGLPSSIEPTWPTPPLEQLTPFGLSEAHDSGSCPGTSSWGGPDDHHPTLGLPYPKQPSPKLEAEASPAERADFVFESGARVLEPQVADDAPDW
ncbi:MAG: hypothetical protein M1836_003761 [Candelina mexicana]|nr:MAG: hypothetical protein M1836_003761 [Candelina mexicana]